MNHIARVLCTQRSIAVPVSRTQPAASRPGKGFTALNVLALAVASAFAFPASGIAGDLPTGGTVVLGSGQITQPGKHQMTITQSTDKLAINWQSFDIGKNDKVTFVQPGASAIALNRVIGSDGSRIMGQLDANGRVFLINPNGVLFGKNASVNVGGLVGSTLALSNEEFANGTLTFHGDGKQAAVVNKGTLVASHGGSVALLGGSVSNQGVITAKLGNVVLAAGNVVTLDFAGDGLLNVQVDEATRNALVENRSLIQATGGQVVMTAAASDALLKTVVNNTGVIEARSLANRGGKIILGAEGGLVGIDGTLRASGKGSQVDISARQINVDRTAAATLNKALTSSDVTLRTVGSEAADGGDITVNAAMRWQSASTLELNAYNGVAINADLTVAGAGGGLAVTTNNNLGAPSTGTGKLSFGDGAVANFTAAKGSGQTLVINDAQYTLLYSLADLDGIDGVSASGKAVNVQEQGFAGNYALARHLNGAGTLYTDSLVSGANLEIFSGNFEGLGHTISNLRVNAGDNIAGLIALTFGGTVSNLGLVNADITGNGITGGLVGYQDFESKIYNSYVTGRVAGGTSVGGLVGFQSGGQIDNSFVAGQVNGEREVGGLVGTVSYGVVRNSYALSNVTGESTVGGLVGSSYFGELSSNYASGNVRGEFAGGFAGDSTDSTLQNNYWNTSTSSATTGVASGTDSAGVTGLTTRQLQGRSLPEGFDSAVWGSGKGLLPYLKSLNPSGVQAWQGKVRVGGRLADSGVVNLYTDGLRGTGVIGDNGEYYIALPKHTQDDPFAVVSLGDRNQGYFTLSRWVGNLSFKAQPNHSLSIASNP